MLIEQAVKQLILNGFSEAEAKEILLPYKYKVVETHVQQEIIHKLLSRKKPSI